jgi:RimJ/RimL family protein N-acetyltransferase
VPLAKTHLGAIAELLRDSDVLRFTRIPEPPPPDFARQWVARCEVGRRDGTCEGFAAVDADGRFLGLALAPEIDRAGRELELGYIVAATARRQGVATEILRQLTDWPSRRSAQSGSPSSSTRTIPPPSGSRSAAATSARA